jgi:hypothetical protein
MTIHHGPIGKYVAKKQARGSHPVPLRSTSYEIEVVSGLAVVRCVRTFKNLEQRPIEATLTFPVPFDAAVTRIEAKVDGRVLVGKAAAKKQARETYEDAIDAGKAAVLHEELLRGLHMLSVANVAPGAEIEVACTFVAPFSRIGDDPTLRIPVTAGQIYGQLPLPDSDQLLTDGDFAEAEVTVISASGTVLLNGGSPKDGKATLPLDRPIEVSVAGLETGPVVGRAADGRAVTLRFGKAPVSNARVDVDILLDVSGSMRESATDQREGNLSKWDVVRAGVVAGADQLGKDDTVGVWVFSGDVREVGRGTGDKLRQLLEKAPFLNGGTETARAVAKVVASRSEANVLLVTDGKSGSPIDIQKAVGSGARFTVVLVGHDALEVNVGYLAALTGGRMFVVPGTDADVAVAEAIKSMRAVSFHATELEGKPKSTVRHFGGAEIAAAWSKAKKDSPARDDLAAHLGGFAAHLALPAMKEDAAAALAEAEGLVSHLTSIVLVDEAGEAVKGIPANRKVSLPTAKGAMRSMQISASGAQDYGTALASRGAGGQFRSRSFLAAESAAPTAMSMVDPSSWGGGGFPGDGMAVGGGWVDNGTAAGTSPFGPTPTVDDSLDRAIQRVRERGGNVSFPAKPPRSGGPGFPFDPTVPAFPTPQRPGGRWPGDFPNLPSVPGWPGVPDVGQPADEFGATHDLEAVGRMVDWDEHGASLLAGSNVGVSIAVSLSIQLVEQRISAAGIDKLVGRSAREVAVALAARAVSAGSRTAARVARSVLKDADEAKLAEALAKAGI